MEICQVNTTLDISISLNLNITIIGLLSVKMIPKMLRLYFGWTEVPDALVWLDLFMNMAHLESITQ